MIYVYGICDPLRALPHHKGIDGAPLELLVGGAVDCVYSTLPSFDNRATPERLWAHEQAVELLMRHGAVLPMRFGTTVTDTDELDALVSKSTQRFRRLLAHVRGCVELGVRVGLPSGASRSPSGHGGGGDYLRNKLLVQRSLREAASSALSPLRQLARASHTREPSSDKDEVSASYLVPEDGIRPFVREVVRLQSSNPQVVLSCTGPWAPYSFVRDRP